MTNDPTFNDMMRLYPEIPFDQLPDLGERYQLPGLGMGFVTRLYEAGDFEEEGRDTYNCILQFYDNDHSIRPSNTLRLTYSLLIKLKQTLLETANMCG